MSIKIENVDVLGWEASIRGLRNPLNSWAKSDSELERDPDYGCGGSCPCMDFGSKMCDLHIGQNDLDLMTRLRNAGTDHRKFMRMITVYVDITAPLYWWKEFDTYKVGTVANSCSTMHKIADKEFELDDFSHEHLYDSEREVLETVIKYLNENRLAYMEMKEENWPMTAKRNWWQMIQLLPSSYNQKRTVMLNYEVLANMYNSRRNHKLDEWHTLCSWIESLPYSELITGGVREDG